MSEFARYQRQMLLPAIREAGQAKLAASRVLLVGCGALGTVLADQLVRAGVGFLRVVDRDLVEWSNLQRQVLFDEADARDQKPKAIAAAERLRKINSAVCVEGVVADVHAGNIVRLADLHGGAMPVDLLLDGTDNAETRYLLNDVAVQHRVPWVYGACVGTEGRVMAVRPGVSACLRCVFPRPPAAGELPTCDTAGVLGPAAGVVASLQAAAAIRLLVDAEPAEAALVTMDVWAGRFRTVAVGGADPACPCCGQRRFKFLEVPLERSTVQLCGRNAVQIRPASPQAVDLGEVAKRWANVGAVQLTRYLLRCDLPAEPGGSLTLFPDGRLLVQGTSDLALARSIAARYLGN